MLVNEIAFKREVKNLKISKSKLDLLLAEKGINLTALAERSGISRQSISTIRGRGTCTPCTAAKLAKGLGVPVAEIIETEKED